MIMVSCDTSTNKSGLALFENGKYKTHVLLDYHKTKDVEERINQMIRGIIDVLQKWNPDIVWIEQPQGHGANVAMVRKLAMILGAVRCWCVCKKREYHEILPSQWRKWLPGYEQGKKTRDELKEESIRYVKEHLDLDCTDDEADSINQGLGILEYYKSLD